MKSAAETRPDRSVDAGRNSGPVLELSDTAASYLNARLAEGLVAPAAAHDHTTVSEPGVTQHR
ncbi:hypothetical protein [Actinomadura sp. 7K534]|uniref:hypothetical protein n=1 Tax=Actinomadura TaxID=1988 RepID=UPI00104531C5|nr:hypothetical protein [Actinomadura sp. 7K534]TDB94951.1 hypothetical protein E1266_15045 [Actinomadura sp. 7K534]